MAKKARMESACSRLERQRSSSWSRSSVPFAWWCEVSTWPMPLSSQIQRWMDWSLTCRLRSWFQRTDPCHGCHIQNWTRTRWLSFPWLDLAKHLVTRNSRWKIGAKTSIWIARASPCAPMLLQDAQNAKRPLIKKSKKISSYACAVI